MSIKSDIRDGIQEIANMGKTGAGGIDSIFSAEVTAVNIDTRSCSVTSISSEVGMDYDTVWLMAQVADGVLYVPKVGSTVIVCNNPSIQPFIVGWTELDKILYIVDDQSVEIKDGLIQFNDGSFFGLVKVKELTTKLNNLENKVNDLVNAWHDFASQYAPGSPSTTGLPAAAIDVSGDLTPTQQADIENDKITHGAHN